MKMNMKKLAAAGMLLVSLLAGCAAKPTAFVVLEDTLGMEEYGIAFRKEDVALGMAVQNTLDEMVADGTISELSEKWFGADVYYADAPLLNPEAQATDGSLDEVLTRGTFVLGLDENFPPMGYRDSTTNEIVGYDIDLAKEVCNRLGVELVLQPIDWAAKELELSTKKIDCVWNGMSITEERQAAMFIPKAYMMNNQVIVTTEATKISTKEDLKGKRVGLQKGSASMDALKAEAEIYEAVKEIVELPDYVTVFMDLKAGRIDAIVVDEVTGRYIMEQMQK